MGKVYTQWTKLEKDDCFIISTLQPAMYVHSDYKMKKGIVGSMLFKEKEASSVIEKNNIIGSKIINAREIIKS